MTKPVASNVTTPFREWLPPVGESPANRIENFARLSEMLKTEFHRCPTQTGSACVTALSSGGRTLSVLPPHHLIVAREEQLVADLSAAYERLALKYEGNYPSFVGFITGPSRTGDIERILVLGAHGPKRLTILLIP